MPSLHIEPTSRCTVKCPLCPRTILINDYGKKFLPIEDIDVDALDQFLYGNSFDSILFCGSYGDTIMHPELKRLTEVCKKYTDTIQLATSGSGRNSRWWDEYIDCLDSGDTIDFAIDGTPENFTEYRINAKWSQIEYAIKTSVAKGIHTRWIYIPFDFNRNTIEDARQVSNSLGVNEFMVRESNRLIPGTGEIKPDCANQRLLYIGSNGQFMPCCHVHDFRFYYKTEWHKNRTQYDISKTTFKECARHFNQFYSTIQTERYDYCVHNCGNRNG